MKILLPPTVIATVAFIVLAIFSYLITKDGSHNFTIGFPYAFYKVTGGSANEFKGWLSVLNVFLSYGMIWTVSVGGYLLWIIKFGKTKQ